MVLCSRFVMICSCNCTIAGSPSVFKTIFVLPVSRMLCSTFLRQFQVGFPLFLSSVWVFTYTSFHAHRTPSSVRQMHCPMFFLFLWRGFRGIPGPPGGSLFVGRPHFQRECPHASAGKGNYPITTTWSSWRPGTFKRDLKGKGKGHVNETLNSGSSPLGQLQDSWSCAPAAHSEHWDPDSDLNSLLPICALSSPSTKIAEPDSRAQVKTRSHGHGKSSRPKQTLVQRPTNSQDPGLQ